VKTPRLLPIPVLLLVAFALSSVACGVQKAIQDAQDRAKKINELHQLGLLYHEYFDANQKGPSRVEDLEQLPSAAFAKDALQGVRSGKYTFIWNVHLLEVTATSGTPNTILAYEPSAQTSKGCVLFVDGSARELTSAEFKTMQLAKPKGGK